MAALIGLDDARLPELVAGAAAHGVFVVANRNAPGQVVVSGERPAIEAGAELARSLGAKRAIVLPVSVAAHSPLMAEAAEGMRAALAGVEFHDPSPGAPGQCRRDRARDRRSLPIRAGRSPDDRRRLDPRGRNDGGGRRHDLRRGRSRARADRPAQTNCSRCRSDPGRRSGLGRSVAGPRIRPGLIPPSSPEENRVRKPDYDRRVVVTGLGVISPVGNDVATAWANLVNGVSGLGPITKFDTTPYEAKLAGEVRDFTASEWMDPKAARRSRVEPALWGRRGQAGPRRFGLRADRREPDGGRGDLRVGRRRTEPDDRQLRDAARARAAGASARRSSPTRWSTAARG